jgi:NitT/TauT family transport system permease protein
MAQNFTLRLPPGMAVLRPNRWDWVAVPVFVVVIAVLITASRQMHVPILTLQKIPITLDKTALPGYAARTTLRLLLALIPSLLFTFIVGPLAAKSRRFGLIIVPLLDIMQSIPVLGYVTFTITIFLALFPNNVLGVESAAIFAVFTAQVWNMTFSFYQSLRTVPRDLLEAATSFGLTSWQKFWRLEVPYAMPGLLWNIVLSMAASWFYIVAQETISVGNLNYSLPGIGSYLSLAISQRDLGAVAAAIGAMTVVIMLYDQLLFRPLVAWADRFKVELSASQQSPRSWFYDLLRRTRLMTGVGKGLVRLYSWVARRQWGRVKQLAAPEESVSGRRWGDFAWLGLLGVLALLAAWRIVHFFSDVVGWAETGRVFVLAAYTMLRVFALVIISTLIWVPLGTAIGLRPKLVEFFQPLSQFLAAFPANVIYPVAVVLILRLHLNPQIWVCAVMLIGAQWYVLFNIIAGASMIPTDLREAAASLGLRRTLLWRRLYLPSIFPFLITGLQTAWGGAWNASIVAEVMNWGSEQVKASGVGAYISENTTAGNANHVALGIGIMALFVVTFNRILWRPLYNLAANRLRCD